MKKFSENIYIIEKLGQGGMGEVFKAKIIKPEQGFEKIVALKVLPEYTAQADKKKEALLKEARIIATLNHPNINQVFDVGEVNGSPYVIMDFIEGHDLRGIIKTAKEKNAQLSISNCIEIALSLLDALEYAHGLSSPIIHRDISPHNVMITNQGIVKLLDFGLSKIQENTDQSKTEGYVGKYSYLPLEVIEGKTYKAEHDIYAVGLILYELLTLEKAYGGNLELEIIQNIKEGHLKSAISLNLKIGENLNNLLQEWIHPKGSRRITEINEIRKKLLLIKKDFIPTSSLKDQIADVFSMKVNFKETVIEKRSVSKQKKTLNLKLLLFLPVITSIVICSILFYNQKNVKKERPFIELIVDNKNYDISPEKLNYTDYANITDTKYFTGQFCQYYCDLTIHQASVFFEPDKTQVLEDMALKSKKRPSEYYMYFLNMIYKNKLTDRLFQGCSHITYCKETEDILNFFTVYPLVLKGNESFKDIAEKNIDAFKKSSLYALWRKNRDLSLKPESNFNLTTTTLKESTYHNISAITKSDLIKMPDDQFPNDTSDCSRWGTTLSLYFNLLNSKNLNILVFPKSSTLQILGTKNENSIILGFPKGGNNDDVIFKKGLCYLEIKNLNLTYSRHWIPENPMSKNGK